MLNKIEDIFMYITRCEYYSKNLFQALIPSADVLKMDSRYAIKPDDSIAEIRSKHDVRLKYFMDERTTYAWLKMVCSHPSAHKAPSKWISIPTVAARLKFATLIEQECMKSTLFNHLSPAHVKVAVGRILKYFLELAEEPPHASYWWTKAAMFRVLTEEGVSRATFCKWGWYGIPQVFKDIADEFLNFEYDATGLEITMVEWDGDNIKLDLPQIPYLSGFYNHHCDILYEQLDEVSPCKMLSYLMTKGFGRRSHLLTAKLRIDGIAIWTLEDAASKHKLKEEAVFTDADIAKLS